MEPKPTMDMTTLDDERLKVLAAPDSNKDAESRAAAVRELIVRDLRAAGYTLTNEHGWTALNGVHVDWRITVDSNHSYVYANSARRRAAQHLRAKVGSWSAYRAVKQFPEGKGGINRPKVIAAIVHEYTLRAREEADAKRAKAAIKDSEGVAAALGQRYDFKQLFPDVTVDSSNVHHDKFELKYRRTVTLDEAVAFVEALIAAGLVPATVRREV